MATSESLGPEFYTSAVHPLIPADIDVRSFGRFLFRKVNIRGVLEVLNYITGCLGNFGGVGGFREEFCCEDRTGGGREHGYLDGFE